MKPPVSDESERLAALWSLDVLDTPPEPGFDDLAELAALICGTPIALISLVDAERQWFKSKRGLETPETPREGSFCTRCIQGNGLLEVPDAREDIRFQDSPLVTGDPGIRFYAGEPLRTSCGQNVGSLCVIDRVPRELSAGQRLALARLARQVTSQLEQRRAAREQRRVISLQRAILDDAAAAIITTSPEGVITHFNPAATRLLGYPAGEVVGRKTPGLFHDAEEVAARAAELTERLGRPVAAGFEVFVAVAQAQGSETREWTYVRQDGSRVPVLLSVSALRDGEGRLTGYLGMASDLTARKVAEQAVRDQESRLRLLQEIGDAVRALSDPGEIMRVTVERLGRWLRASRCACVDVAADGDGITIRHDYTDGCASVAGRYRLGDFGQRVGERLRAGECLVVRDVASELPGAEGGPGFAQLGIQAVICCGLVKKGALRAMMAVHQTVPRDWSAAEVEVVREVAERCWATMESARAQGELAANERFVRAALDALSAEIVILDAAGHLVTANRAWWAAVAEGRAAWGATADTVDLLRHCEGLPPDAGGAGQGAAILREILAGSRKEGAFEYFRPLGEGEGGRWFLCRATQFHGDGEIRVALAHEDISAVKEAQQLAERKQEQLRVLFDLAPEAIIMIGADGRIARVNQRVESVFGYTRQELKGRPAVQLLPGYEGLRAAAAGPVPGERPLSGSGCRQDGTVFPAEISLSPLETETGPLLAAAVRDISRRVTSEREMRLAHATLDAIEDATYIFDPETRCFSYVNRAAIRTLGYSREELLRMSPLDVGDDIDETAFHQLLDSLVNGDKDILLHTHYHRTKSGQRIPVEVNIQYIQFETGPRFIAIARNISGRLLAEQKARRAQRLESIGTLAGGVAHDINNALTPILMTCPMLRMGYPAGAEMIDAIESSAQRGADMVRQLLTFARGAEGERVPVDPAGLVREVARLMQSTFPKNIRLEVECRGALPAVTGDATQLHQVLVNLCVNARDAMPDGGTLRVDARGVVLDAASLPAGAEQMAAGPFVRLQVRDEGTGIDPQIAEKIFDPFFTTKMPDKGTGLGLSTVMGIVRAHGGFLQMQSQVGEGSTFTLYLPVCEAGLPAAAPEKKPGFRGHGETILLVEDEPVLRKIAEQVLQRLNFRAVTAADGRDGLAQVAQHRENPVRAVITDLHMPNLDGIGFARECRRLHPDLPVVVASGRLDDGAHDEFTSLGIAGRLHKPYTEEQLADVLGTLLGRGRPAEFSLT